MATEIKRFEIEFNLNWEYGVKITKIEEDIKKLKELGATHIDIDSYLDYDNSFVSLDAYVLREETDQEKKERINKEAAKSSLLKKQELAELKRLQDKYKK